MGTNEEDKEKYNLYTEKIVLHPAKKYRWLIQIGKALLFMASVAVAAIIFMVFLYPVVQKKMEERNKEKDVVYIQKDNYILAEGETGEDKGKLTEQDLKENYEQAMATLRAKVEDVKKCLVTVDIEQPATQIPTVEKSETEVTGLVVAHNYSRYLILTSERLLSGGSRFVVKLGEDTQIEATAVCKDEVTGIGILSINELGLTKEQKDALSVAVLDNSYKVRQGDLVIAAGKIYETSKGIDYGTIAGIRTEYSKDNGYEVFETNITVTAGGFGILFNSDGRVVGISKASADSTMKFIGISDLKAPIETMINSQGIMYCGITGQNVTDELAAKYGLPSGVYISAVDIDSPAYYAGLQAGDVINRINGESILTIQQFSEKLYQCADGDTMYVTAKRQGKDGYSDVLFSVNVQLKQL
ncbi:MAG: S1C family serine protease [Clostridia bacterium]|nr:S1C family serine protease [Clostridia bacterium]